MHYTSDTLWSPNIWIWTIPLTLCGRQTRISTDTQGERASVRNTLPSQPCLATKSNDSAWPRLVGPALAPETGHRSFHWMHSSSSKIVSVIHNWTSIDSENGWHNYQTIWTPHKQIIFSENARFLIFCFTRNMPLRHTPFIRAYKRFLAKVLSVKSKHISLVYRYAVNRAHRYKESVFDEWKTGTHTVSNKKIYDIIEPRLQYK